MNFKICDDVSALGIKAAFLILYNINNDSSYDKLKNKIYSFYENFINVHTLHDLDYDKNILGYRKLHSSIGVTEKSLVASPESLIKLLHKYKTLRPINNLVDIYNYIAIKNKISIGAHDLDQIAGNVRLCMTNGNESFTPLGRNKPQNIIENEYCYIDDNDEILCRLDCRQCDKTKTSKETKNCLFIIQGHKDIPIDLIKSTSTELQSIFKPHPQNEKEVSLIIL